ncbi:MAG: TRAP transporter small permease [Lachnospiraceae bacterium]|nr:TRAP transporter small permease [Lachnospiraceae bacterium]
MKLRKILNQIAEKMSIVILAVMVILVVWQVGARYIMKAPIPWSEQLSKYLFIWLVLINSTYMFGKKEHMSIGYFKEKLPQTAQIVINYLIEVVTFVFAGFILILGGYMAMKIGIPQKDAAIGISMGFVYAALPISGLMTALYGVCNFIDLVKKNAKSSEISLDKKAASSGSNKTCLTDCR